MFMKETLARYIQKKVKISDEDLQFILSHFKPRTVKKKEILLHEGDLSNRMYFVVKGCLRIYFIKDVGTEVTRRIIFENDASSSMVSFITQNRSKEYIEAVMDSELLYMDRKDFYHLVETLPIWEKFYRHQLEYAYVINTNRLMSFITNDATERYLLLLKENPEIIKRLPNRLVANYLNITQEGLSRLKSKL
ncbi:cAMP-binding domain of CRP or a regulatory subunit of cAMP-dependent protein kinases [Mucilaginibacter sp. OK283]|jgi:CRP-like cAMP-binding protein|nr:cAMP-binding domain of CRP or a regulatory subunit of cAMP-dependent protein kinases [Mucilaginibacter sp. OK283]